MKTFINHKLKYKNIGLRIIMSNLKKKVNQNYYYTS